MAIASLWKWLFKLETKLESFDDQSKISPFLAAWELEQLNSFSIWGPHIRGRHRG